MTAGLPPRPKSSHLIMGTSTHHAFQEDTMAGKGSRTTHRSSSGKKLYAVRDAKGRFKDIQSYARAHGADLKRKSKKEK